LPTTLKGETIKVSPALCYGQVFKSLMLNIMGLIATLLAHSHSTLSCSNSNTLTERCQKYISSY